MLGVTAREKLQNRHLAGRARLIMMESAGWPANRHERKERTGEQWTTGQFGRENNRRRSSVGRNFLPAGGQPPANQHGRRCVSNKFREFPRISSLQVSFTTKSLVHVCLAILDLAIAFSFCAVLLTCSRTSRVQISFSLCKQCASPHHHNAEYRKETIGRQ